MQNQKKLLAIDTATGNFSLALYDVESEKLLELFVSPDANKHAEMLVPEIENLLARHKLKHLDLDFLAVNIGPGSFTGLRIGLSVVKAWQLVLRAQAIPVTSLEAAAFIKNGGEVHLDARRGQAFYQKFDANLQPICAPQLIDYSTSFDSPANAEAIAQVALVKLKNGEALGQISPLYIRAADAKLPNKL
jgi:tRNA threonylcarbamoyl adenosine modification protein YeaZ